MTEAVGIFFGFPGDVATDRQLKAVETDVLAYVVSGLEGRGFAVVVVHQASADDFVAWVTGTHSSLEGKTPAAMLWSAHGDSEGLLQTCDGSELGPDSTMRQLKAQRLAVHEGLRLAVFSSCHTGAHAQRWHRALGGKTTIVGYDGIAVLSDVLEMYSSQGGERATLEELFRAYLMNPAIGA